MPTRTMDAFGANVRAVLMDEFAKDGRGVWYVELGSLEFKADKGLLRPVRDVGRLERDPESIALLDRTDQEFCQLWIRIRCRTATCPVTVRIGRLEEEENMPSAEDEARQGYILSTLACSLTG